MTGVFSLGGPTVHLEVIIGRGRGIMGLPALQQFRQLSAAVEARSDDAVRVGEVVSFSLGDVVKSISEVVTVQAELRQAIAEVRKLIDDVTDQDLASLSVSEVAQLRVSTKRLNRIISRPMLARPTGTSLVSVAEALEKARPARLGDRRLMLRQAKHVRDSAEPCERERGRLRDRLTTLSDRLEKVVENSGDLNGHEIAYMAALVSTTRNRHPVINAYLAR